MFPKLQPLQTKTDVITRFGGYCHTSTAKPGEWFDMENLSAREYPLLTPRPPRGKLPGAQFTTGGQLIAKEGLWRVQGDSLVGFDPLTNKPIHTFEQVFSHTPHLVSFDTRLVDLSAGVWFSTRPNGSGTYEQGQFIYRCEGSGEAFSVYLCDERGEPLSVNCFGVSPPEQPVGGMLWLDTTDTPATLKRYYEDSASYAPEQTFLRIAMGCSLAHMEEGDFVEISLPTVTNGVGESYGLYDPKTPKKVLCKGENPNGSSYFVVEGGLTGCLGYHLFEGKVTVEQTTAITEGFTLRGGPCFVENAVPLLDFGVSCGNRLWGCRYGRNRKGELVNEIYASAPGNFRVWERFEGIASDSYALSCGSDGPFTGAAVYGGNPLFFKENTLHRIYGTYPFSATALPCNGVARGSEQSLAVVNNRMIYQSRWGLCTYSGSLPTLLDLPFGGKRYTHGVAAANSTLYYLSTVDESEQPVLFVYDTQRDILTKEDGVRARYMAAVGEDIFATVSTGEGMEILVLTGKTSFAPAREEAVCFFGQTGRLGESAKGTGYLHGLELNAQLSAGSTLTVQVQYNGKGEFTPLATLKEGHFGRVRVPLRLRPCQYFTLRLKGKGECTLYSLTHLTRTGGTKCI